MKRVTILSLLLTLVLLLTWVALATSASAGGAQVTSGEFQTFAAGTGVYEIGGRAIMQRIPSGKTLVEAHVTGLLPDTTYPVHVHNMPCDTNNGGGHYQNVVGGPVDNVNEIWLTFTTNSAGIGTAHAEHGFIARPEAQSIVVHAPDGSRIACADLD